MIYIILIIVFIILFLFIRWRYFGIARLNKYYKNYGVVTVGKRGKGKDISFATAVHKKKHYSNIPYNSYTIIQDDLKVLECGVTPKQLIDNDYEIQQKKLQDGIPFFVSDGGIYFASWLDNELKKKYPSCPVSYAVWRHLYNSSLHFNTQCFSRLWLLIREQAECILSCRQCFTLFKWKLCVVRYYEDFQDCEQNLSPLKKPLLFGKQPVAIENSRRGEIRDFIYLVPLKWLEYDSRIFHKKIFGVNAPLTKRQQRKQNKHKKKTD